MSQARESLFCDHTRRNHFRWSMSLKCAPSQMVDESRESGWVCELMHSLGQTFHLLLHRPHHSQLHPAWAYLCQPKCQAHLSLDLHRQTAHQMGLCRWLFSAVKVFGSHHWLCEPSPTSSQSLSLDVFFATDQCSSAPMSQSQCLDRSCRGHSLAQQPWNCWMVIGSLDRWLTVNSCQQDRTKDCAADRHVRFCLALQRLGMQTGGSHLNCWTLTGSLLFHCASLEAGRAACLSDCQPSLEPLYPGSLACWCRKSLSLSSKTPPGLKDSATANDCFYSALGLCSVCPFLRACYFFALHSSG